MSIAEVAYQNAISEMTVHQKMARVEGLLHWVRNMIARKIRAELGPEVSDERIRWEVALQMYGADPQMRQLIEEQIARVSA